MYRKRFIFCIKPLVKVQSMRTGGSYPGGQACHLCQGWWRPLQWCGPPSSALYKPPDQTDSDQSLQSSSSTAGWFLRRQGFPKTATKKTTLKCRTCLIWLLALTEWVQNVVKLRLLNWCHNNLISLNQSWRGSEFYLNMSVRKFSMSNPDFYFRKRLQFFLINIYAVYSKLYIHPPL